MLEELGTAAAVADAGAAGATGGGSDQGASGGAEGGGSGASGGTPPGDTGGAPGSVEQPVKGGDAALTQDEIDAEPEADFDPEAEGIDADGRKLDIQTRTALAQLKKMGAEGAAAAKRLAGTYFRANNLVKELGVKNLSEAVVKVRNQNATFEALGGEEGIEGMQTEISDYRREIDQFASGDPALLIQLNEANPEQFVTAIVNGLDLIGEKNPEGLDKALFPHIVAKLEKSGMYKAIGNLANLIKEGKGQEAYDLTAELSQWLTKAKTFADNQKTLKTQRNPEREALDRERKEIDQERRTNYNNAVSADVNKMNNLAQARIVEPFFKDLKLPNEGRREFVNALNSRIWKKMEGDKIFQRNASAKLDKGDAAEAARYVSAKFQELLPGEFRTLRDVMYPHIVQKAPAKAAAKPGAPAAGNGAGGGAPASDSSGFKLVAKMPAPSEIDWGPGKTTEEMYHVGRGEGRAILKTGAKIRFDWSKVER